MIEFLFCDLDDTLLKRYHHGSAGINQYNVQALHRLQKNGIRTVINTARSPFFLNKISSKKFEHDYIAWNGAEIYQNQTLLSSSYVNREHFYEFLHMFPEVIANMRVTLHDGTALYMDEKSAAYRLFEKDGPICRDYNQCKFVFIPDYSIEKHITDFHLFFQDRVETDTFFEKVMHTKFFNVFTFGRIGDRIFDVTSMDCGKGNAVVRYMNIVQKHSDFAVIGDSENDIPMMRLTPYSFCMVSGHKRALEASNYHVHNVAECVKKILYLNRMESRND